MNLTVHRYAVLSDIHSNVWALDAVIDDALAKGVTQFINLGDILYGPLAPKRTYERLMQLADVMRVITIRGNQDRDIINATTVQRLTNATLDFVCHDLTKPALRWLTQLPATAQLPQGLMLCHGTPTSDLIYLLEAIEHQRPVLRDASDLNQQLAGLPQNTRLLLCGHSHLPRQVTVSEELQIINPGSVGLPAYADNEPQPHRMETGSNCAQYAIITCDATGKWHGEQQAVNYDVEAAAHVAEKRQRHDWATALRSGYAA